MDRLNEILHRKYYVREIVLLVFIVLGLLYLSIYTSFAIFEKTVEKVGAVAFEASAINLSLSSDETSFSVSGSGDYGTITVPAGKIKAFDITIKNETPIDVKYKTWYRFTSGVTILDVEVGISNQSENENTSTLTKNGEEGYQKIVRVIIKNNSTQSATIDIGVQGGYAANEVALNTNYSEISTIINEIYKDSSNANLPELASGMIPVIYDETNDVWRKADLSEKWYDYDEQWWANAVTTTSTNRATYLSDEHIGKEIPMDEINSMWVWIPRFKYNIASEYGIHSTGENGTIENPGLINVMFESEKNSSGSPYSEYKTSTTTKYYTHPAFRNGNAVYNESPYDIGGWDEEITGFWVAKFEGDNIKPDVKSRTTDYYAQFDAGLKFANGTRNPDNFTITFAIDTENEYGLNTTTNKTDTHMMKNTEWGAVAYLSQSRYGKSGNQSYSSTQKRIYPNNSQDAYADSEEWDYVYTGRSSGDTEAGILVGYAGYYSYNDYKCGKNQAKCNETPQLLKGTGASTTGTIYGIYDMRGGWDEALAAQVSSSNSYAVLKFLNKIDPKYKDFYSNIYYDFYGVDETCDWYEENCGISSGFIRKASIFSRDSTTRLDLEHSFRVVLMP